ncbi:MAG: methyltransferase domain-containing protein [Opitutaceae bacterium]
MNQAAVRDFFDGWATYEAILDHGVMHHGGFFAAAAAALERDCGTRPLAVLDLGCGSARHAARLFTGRPGTAYVGYDLSTTALAAARATLTAAGVNPVLHAEDFRRGLAGPPDSVDLILCSYALHHLETTGKGAALAAARRRLRPGGRMLLIDVAQEAGETRAVTTDAYATWVQRAWTFLPAAARRDIRAHLLTHDFPEQDATLFRLARDAGWMEPAAIARERWHRAWWLRPAD